MMTRLLRPAVTMLVLAVAALPSPAQEGKPILPAADPAVAPEAYVRLRPDMRNRHPRLLITDERVEKLRAFYRSDAGALYRRQMESYVAGCTVPADRRTTDGWAQTHGLFKLPTVALHYRLTGDRDSFAKAVAYLKWLAGTADWSRGGEPEVPDTIEAYTAVLDRMKAFGPSGERNSDHAASFTMVGAALVFDWLYDELDPAFRELFGEVLFQHARAMYYGGHLEGNPGGNYWRGVPAYNHRWFRDWGMTLAVLAAVEGEPGRQWLLGEVKKELDFMVRWLPVDGSQHEGPGYGSSAGALGMAFLAADDVLGTDYLASPFYTAAAEYTLQVAAPGLDQAMYFADCFTRARSFHPFFMLTAARDGQADVLDGIRRAMALQPNAFGVQGYAWLSLIADDPSLAGGDYRRLKTTAFLPDLGIAIVRDSWADDAVAARFKCGPMGGYKANAWRPTARNDAGALPYLNVAHDHPDANSFTLFGSGDYIAETDRYPLRPGKLSSSQNTILVDGIGQAAEGRPEGQDWQQPASGDMTDMGRITAFADFGNVVLVEGEASGSYLPYNHDGRTRPGLDRFRRAMIWVRGDYLLVVDDIRCPQQADLTWLVQGAELETLDAGAGRYRLSKNAARCAFQLVCDRPLSSTIGVSTANDHSTLLNWKQLQATAADSETARFAAVFDPWGRGDLSVKLTPASGAAMTVTVTGPGINDTWTYAPGAGRFDASTWRGRRAGGFDVTADARTAQPPSPLAERPAAK
ncbi:MAG: hypothetical protein GX591_10010 [Planctomycetes bacterium]|nr:hypothetical protein [Planctomycetota bacterium]